jgi:electron transport complex protein RnfE
MTTHSIRSIAWEGLWSNNPALVQLLGLCPLLAVTDTMVNGLALGVATLLVWVLSSTTISLIRNLIRPEIRIPVFVLIIATFVTMVELSMSAYFYELHQTLGVFVPLIVTNCAIIGRAEAFASRQPAAKAMLDGLAMGLGFAAVLVSLGALRELVAQATLFSDAHLIFGEAASFLTVKLTDEYPGFLLATLPPGAFIGLGLILALRNLIESRRQLQISNPVSVASPGGPV